MFREIAWESELIAPTNLSELRGGVMSELFRELTAEEVAFVAGGDDVVITGRRYNGGGSGGNVNSWGWEWEDFGSNGWDTQGGSAEPPQVFSLKDVDCGLERSNFEAAVSALLEMSGSADVLMTMLRNSGHNWQVNLIDSGNSGTQLALTQINWNPYEALHIRDAQGNIIGHQSPMIGLAHEFAEAAFWNLGGSQKDAMIMLYENAIIDEINQYLGVQQETKRASHYHGAGDQYIAASSTSTTEVAERPQCSS